MAFFEVLGLTLVAQPLNQLLNVVFSYIPKLFAALVLAVIAWIIATLLLFCPIYSERLWFWLWLTYWERSLPNWQSSSWREWDSTLCRRGLVWLSQPLRGRKLRQERHPRWSATL
ncbi:MAG: hypothetical protein JW999_04285 [Methanotrichaceae archaeon]|nr:hypothetical protein [Methanotrichaceae archaeon]